MTAQPWWRGRPRDPLSTPERLAVETAFAGARMSVLLSRDGEEKARILEVVQRGQPAYVPAGSLEGRAAKAELFAALGNPTGPRARDNGATARHCEPLVLRAPDVDGAARRAGELAATLGAAGRTECAAARTIATLRAEASALLEDGRGPIARCGARLRALDAALCRAREDEAAERAQIEALLRAAAPLVDLERERNRLLAEREHWRALLRLWPDWQQLQEAGHALEELAAFARLPDDLQTRAAATAVRSEQAESALCSTRRRVGELQSARDEMRAQPVAPFAPVAADVVRLIEALPTYRARLLELAAARGRLADLERTLATGLERRGREVDVIGLAALLTPGRRAELQHWQERLCRARASRTAATQALAALSERVRDVSSEVREQLARDGSDTDDDVDGRWRLLWQLRRHLDEIWEVQSRAESRARTLREREGALRALAAETYWTPGGRLQRALKVIIVLAATAGVGAALNRSVYAIPLAGLVAALAVLRLGLHARARWVRVLEQRRGRQRARLRAEAGRLRQGCDADWAQAARLTDAIRQASARLGLREAASPETLDSYEQALAAQMRAAGAQTPLTARLLELLEAQEVEPGCAAALAGAEGGQRRLESEWEAWRREVGLPGDIEVDRAGAWADEVVQLAAACAARDAARADLLAIEPGIGAWEDETRGVLARVGITVSPELCGSALAGELNALAARARAEEDRRLRCVRLDAELRDAEQQLVEATAELERAGAARSDLMAAAGVGAAIALDAQLDGLRRWREARARRDRLQASIDGALSELAAAPAVRADLAAGAIERWSAELRDGEAGLDQLDEQVEHMAERRRAAEQRLDAARTACRVTDLRLEREQVLAELGAAARAWKLRVLAAALLEGALQEHMRSDSRELLQRASVTLATLTGGRFTGIVRAEEKDGLALVDGARPRLPVDAQLGQALRAQVFVSLVLGRAAQLANRGAPIAVVLDDALAALSLDEARLAAQEIACVARTCPVVYLTTAANRERVLSAMPGDVAVLDVDAGP